MSDSEFKSRTQPVMIQDEGELAFMVGSIVVQAAKIENLLTLIFVGLAGGGPKAELLGSGQDVAWLVRHCRALADREADSTSWKKRMQDALKLAEDAIQLRNRVVHATWLSEPDGRVRGQRPRRLKDAEVFAVSGDDLMEYKGMLDVAWSALFVAGGEALHETSEAGG